MQTRSFDGALRSAWMAVSKMYNREASKFHSTMATGFALLNIDAAGTPSTALGPKMGMENTSLSRLLNAMEEKQLIRRSPDPEDGRRVLIFLTPFGKEKRDVSKSVVLRFNALLEADLNPIQIKHFFEVIETITTHSSVFEQHKNNPKLNTGT
ncbi:MAG: MarR family winged helix-turn-helix transcriptional regulator [Flavobacteriaceae bacterium]|jgi:DNA-binding MarR family transcriptional regulator